MNESKDVIVTSRALSLISHKLKTPLSIINGYSEAILSQAKKEKFSPFTSKALEEINKQGGRMSLLVDKLMAFNKVSAAQTEGIEKQPVYLKNLIKECASKAIAQEEETAVPAPVQDDSSVKRGTFVEIDCSEHLSVTANEEMLRLCIRELLANAIKFNNKMEKIIKVQCANHGDSISISVRDYGAGIRPQDVNRIFEPFYSDGGNSSRSSGTGLGLSIVKSIIENFHASINVSSQENKGTCFTLNFPAVIKK